MEPEFWHERWKQRELGFNQAEPNALLVKHFKSLGLGEGDRVFLPLCGKTVDIHWVLAQGCRVAGVELSETAVSELFQELHLQPEVTPLEGMKRYSGPGLEIFVGDLFHLSASALGPVQAVYDRAAMVALPQDIRERYAAHLIEITGNARQLLITFTYDQTQMEGPPFSIPPKEIEDHYRDSYRIVELESRPVEGKLKGTVAATESIRLLTRST